MKNLKTILLGVFVIISATEMSYPIIFTGPGRRNAHRQEQQDAYEAGMMAGSKQDQSADSDTQDQNSDSDSDTYNSNDVSDDVDNVAIQRTSRREENNVNDELEDIEIQSMSDQDMEQGNDYIDPAFAQNYADDATVQIQTIGDGSMLQQLQNATPAQKAALKAALQSRSGGVTTQALEQGDDENSMSEDSSVDQALKDAGLDDDFAAATQEQENTESDSDNVAIQSIEAEVKHEDAVKPAETEVKTPAAQATPAVQATVVVKTEEVKIPVAQVAPVVQAASVVKTEEIKIVKVYPVYDAVRSAIKSVHTAAQDMLNYLYSFITMPAKSAAAEVKATVEVKAEKVETKP